MVTTGTNAGSIPSTGLACVFDAHSLRWRQLKVSLGGPASHADSDSDAATRRIRRWIEPCCPSRARLRSADELLCPATDELLCPVGEIEGRRRAAGPFLSSELVGAEQLADALLGSMPHDTCSLFENSQKPFLSDELLGAEQLADALLGTMAHDACFPYPEYPDYPPMYDSFPLPVAEDDMEVKPLWDRGQAPLEVLALEFDTRLEPRPLPQGQKRVTALRVLTCRDCDSGLLDRLVLPVGHPCDWDLVSLQSLSVVALPERESFDGGCSYRDREISKQPRSCRWEESDQGRGIPLFSRLAHLSLPLSDLPPNLLPHLSSLRSLRLSLSAPQHPPLLSGRPFHSLPLLSLLHLSLASPASGLSEPLSPDLFAGLGPSLRSLTFLVYAKQKGAGEEGDGEGEDGGEGGMRRSGEEEAEEGGWVGDEWAREDEVVGWLPASLWSLTRLQHLTTNVGGAWDCTGLNALFPTHASHSIPPSSSCSCCCCCCCSSSSGSDPSSHQQERHHHQCFSSLSNLTSLSLLSHRTFPPCLSSLSSLTLLSIPLASPLLSPGSLALFSHWPHLSHLHVNGEGPAEPAFCRTKPGSAKPSTGPTPTEPATGLTEPATGLTEPATGLTEPPSCPEATPSSSPVRHLTLKGTAGVIPLAVWGRLCPQLLSLKIQGSPHVAVRGWGEQPHVAVRGWGEQLAEGSGKGSVGHGACGEGDGACGEGEGACGEGHGACGEENGACGEGDGACGEGEGACGEGHGACGEGEGACGEGEGACGEGEGAWGAAEEAAACFFPSLEELVLRNVTTHASQHTCTAHTCTEQTGTEHRAHTHLHQGHTLAFMGRLPRLTHLAIDHTHSLSHPPTPTHAPTILPPLLPNLTFLRIHSPPPAPLPVLPHLRTLIVGSYPHSSRFLSSLSLFPSLTALRIFNLSTHNYHSALSCPPSLKSLQICFSHLPLLPDSLRLFSSITHLHLFQCSTPLALPACLSAFSSLAHVSFGSDYDPVLPCRLREYLGGKTWEQEEAGEGGAEGKGEWEGKGEAEGEWTEEDKEGGEEGEEGREGEGIGEGEGKAEGEGEGKREGEGEGVQAGQEVEVRGPPKNASATYPHSHNQSQFPAEVLPAEVLPAEVLPAEVLPAEVLPAEAVPAEVLECVFQRIQLHGDEASVRGVCHEWRQCPSSLSSCFTRHYRAKWDSEFPPIWLASLPSPSSLAHTLTLYPNLSALLLPIVSTAPHPLQPSHVRSLLSAAAALPALTSLSVLLEPGFRGEYDWGYGREELWEMPEDERKREKRRWWGETNSEVERGLFAVLKGCRGLKELHISSSSSGVSLHDSSWSGLSEGLLLGLPSCLSSLSLHLPTATMPTSFSALTALTLLATNLWIPGLEGGEDEGDGGVGEEEWDGERWEDGAVEENGMGEGDEDGWCDADLCPNGDEDCWCDDHDEGELHNSAGASSIHHNRLLPLCSLSSLTLSSCCSFPPLIRHLTRLTSLSLGSFGADGIGSSTRSCSLHHGLSRLTRLRELSLCCDSFSQERLPRLPRLRRLHVQNYSDSVDMARLMAAVAHSLEQLHIDCQIDLCETGSNRGLSFRKLKLLHLEFFARLSRVDMALFPALEHMVLTEKVNVNWGVESGFSNNLRFLQLGYAVRLPRDPGDREHELMQLTALTTLIVDNADYRDFLAALSCFSSLRTLRLSNITRGCSEPYFSCPPLLSTLQICFSDLPRLPPSLAHFSRLTRLDLLHWRRLHSLPPFLSSFSSLHHLRVTSDGPKPTHPACLKGFLRGRDWYKYSRCDGRNWHQHLHY
ncbi:unnamed protein product [Closterium sp. Naga37s-1]|nr:unnamed protein product [Closterium sp. Naga37s-1]